MKVKIPLRNANRLINHGPLVLVACQTEKNRVNCLPIAWIMPVRHDPPIIGAVIGKGNYSFEWIRKHREFTVNIPPAGLLTVVNACGSVTGADLDKFEKYGLTAEKASAVKAPLIRECIGHLECEIINDPSLIETYNLFLAHVKAVSVEKEAFEEIWKLDREEYRTIHHLGGSHFVLDGKTVKA
ncbi:MAG: flavin reductase family protein [Candidatus Eremiobacteraeota bacterium]|nr:flavin reductase family protein [Candidatus Eremiobacteraeota bacterium]